mmetsp:Transcript_11503/g.20823  ORF Transcript_11503/g.20823 Transcript_11503/m.20823 type:complete len:395 (-) Transcript_11503:322-1506(-)
MGCTASVAAAPERQAALNPAAAKTGSGPSSSPDGQSGSTSTETPKSAIRAGPSGRGPKKGVSFRKKETELLGPRKVDPSASSETPAGGADAAAPADTSPPAETSATETKHGEQASAGEAAADMQSSVPDSDPVFDDDAVHAPGEKLLEKSNVNKRGNLKHFGVRQSVDRDMDATAATQNLFKKSTGVVPKVFVDSVFSTYDLNGDGTISQSELEALARDLQADYRHLKDKLIGEDNPDGTVSRDALMNWFYNEHSNSQMRMIFDRMDTDSSGFIERGEIPNVLKLCAENISEENVDTAMSTLDRDGDMKISFDEFTHWFNNDCKLVTYRSFFSLYANTGDGEDKIGLAELEEMLIAMGGKKEHIKVQETLDEIDTNKNGFVELEEFIAWSVTHN